MNLPDEIVETGLKPHRKAIAEIASRGEIAVVLHGQPHPMAAATLKEWGCTGEPVFALRRTPAVLATFRPDNASLRKWLHACPVEIGAARIICFCVLVPLFIDFSPASGFVGNDGCMGEPLS